jgi:hypothetical protein
VTSRSSAPQGIDARAVGRAKPTRDFNPIAGGQPHAHVFFTDGDEVRMRWERIVAR